MTKTTRLLAISVAFLMAVAVGTASPSAHARIAVIAVDSAVTEQGSIATAKFKLQVVNQDTTPLTAVKVVFDGDIEVVIGDVAAEATVVSGGQKFMFDTTHMPPTRSFIVPVKVKFIVDGVESEISTTLSLKRAE